MPKPIVRQAHFKTVALIKGDSRYQNIRQALGLLEKQIKTDIKKHLQSRKSYILIKPNFVTTRHQLAATHVDAIRAVLDFLQPLWKGRIIIGEGAGIGHTSEGFKNYGYLPLKSSYPNVELFDLNQDDGVDAQGTKKDGKPLKLKISKTLSKAAFRISVTPMKTHDTAIITLGIKNSAVGGLLKQGFKPINFATRMLLRRPFRDYKSIIHQGYPAIHKTIAQLFLQTFPHLSVIDGFQGMERNGPVGGDEVAMRSALVSTDALSADTLGAYLMGFNPQDIGYLHHLGANLDKVNVVGFSKEACRKKFRPHDLYLQQIKWR